MKRHELKKGSCLSSSFHYPWQHDIHLTIFTNSPNIPPNLIVSGNWLIDYIGINIIRPVYSGISVDSNSCVQ